MEQSPYRRRPARQKLKMPLIGSLLGGDSNSTAKEPNILSGKLTPIIIGAFVLIYGLDYWRNKNDTHRVFQGVDEIQEMAWEGKILKKWANIIPPNSEIHYVLQVKEPKGEVKTIDLGNEKTGFGDLVMPKNTVIKKAGSFEITLKRYFKNDTTITLKY